MPSGAARQSIPPPPHPPRAPTEGRGPRRRAAKRVLLPPETYGFGVRNVSFRAPKPYLLPRPPSATAHPARRLRAFATPCPPRRARPAPDETGKNTLSPHPPQLPPGRRAGGTQGRAKAGASPMACRCAAPKRRGSSGRGRDEMGVFRRKARSPAPHYAPRAVRAGGKRERGDGIASRDTVPPGHINYNKPMLNLYNVCRMKSVAYLARRGSTLRALPLAMRSTTMPRFCPTRARRPSMV